MNERILERAIRVEGVSDIFRKMNLTDPKMLPSTSQWHNFRQVALTGDIESMCRFLEKRPFKKKTAKKWIFKVAGKPFYVRIRELFLDTAKAARNIRSLTKNTPFTLIIKFPTSLAVSEDYFESIKNRVARIAVCDFIDQVLLFQQGLSYRINRIKPDGKALKMEVCSHE